MKSTDLEQKPYQRIQNPTKTQMLKSKAEIIEQQTHKENTKKLQHQFKSKQKKKPPKST